MKYDTHRILDVSFWYKSQRAWSPFIHVVTREKIFALCIYVPSASKHFAVLQLISAAKNKLGLIRDQSAQTTT